MSMTLSLNSYEFIVNKILVIVIRSDMLETKQIRRYGCNGGRNSDALNKCR